MSIHSKSLIHLCGALFAGNTLLFAQREAPARFVCEVTVVNAQNWLYQKAFAFEVSDPSWWRRRDQFWLAPPGGTSFPSSRSKPGMTNCP